MLYLFLLVPLVSAVPSCKPGNWGPWGTCDTAVSCQTAAASGFQVQTKPLEVTTAWDQGRTAMTASMKQKMEHYSRAGLEPVTYPKWQGSFKCDDGAAGEIPCMNVEQMAFLDINQLGYEPSKLNDTDIMGNDCWGWTDPETGDEYAIMGVSGGTSFVRITDPRNPFVVGFMYSQTVASIWRDIKVVKNWAYIGSEARFHGMQIFDLTRLRGVRNFQPDLKPERHYDEVGNSHNIVANEETDFIYIVGAWHSNNGTHTPCAGGLHVVDVKDPRNAKFAGCFDADGYTHDAQCVIYKGPDARYFNREICFGYNENSLTIIDVTDKNDMKLVSKRSYNGVMYTHQGWLSADHSLLLLDDELDEWEPWGQDPHTKTFIWDITSLENPFVKHVHQHPHTSIDHNQYIKGQFSYQANYESGLRIMFIDQKNFRLHEVGYFDVRPDRTTADWQGSWSVYPYFRSGTVIISSIDYGLFVVRPDTAAMETVASAIRRGENVMNLQGTQARSQQSSSGVSGASCQPQSENKPCIHKCQ